MPFRNVADISSFLTSWLSQTLGRPIEATATFSAIGLDSFEAVRLIDVVAARLGQELNPIIVIDYPSIDSLAEHVATLVK